MGVGLEGDETGGRETFLGYCQEMRASTVQLVVERVWIEGLSEMWIAGIWQCTDSEGRGRIEDGSLISGVGDLVNVSLAPGGGLLKEEAVWAVVEGTDPDG